MESLIVLIVLAVLGYPFFAAWFVGKGRNARIDALERQVADLRGRIDALQRAPAPAAAPAVVPVPVPPTPRAQAAPPPAPEPTPAAPVATPAPAAAPPVPASAAAATTPLASTAVPAQPPATAQPAPRPAPAAPSTSSASSAPSAPVRAASAPSASAATGGWVHAARTWLFTGNLVAKLGLVILFIAALPDLRLRWRPATLVFVAGGKPPYTLAFGRAGVPSARLPLEQVAPGFDARDLGRLETAGTGQLVEQHAGAAIDAAGENAAQGRIRWLWALLVAGVGALAWMAWRLVAQLKRDDGGRAAE